MILRKLWIDRDTREQALLTVFDEADGAYGEGRKLYGSVRLPSGALVPPQTRTVVPSAGSAPGATLPEDYIGKEVYESEGGFPPVRGVVGGRVGGGGGRDEARKQAASWWGRGEERSIFPPASHPKRVPSARALSHSPKFNLRPRPPPPLQPLGLRQLDRKS